MQMIPTADLHPHPDNPRIVPREDVIEQIAAQINGRLDEAHALIVRPREEGGFEIISGHNRFAAAGRAGLAELPCWVREMSDEDAYMALALNNAQGELHPLERGLHALGSGLSVREYADRSGQSKSAVQFERQAAEVYRALSTHVDSDQTRHLAEIHTAPRWLWPALVETLLEKGWSVEVTRKAVQRLKDVPEPPAWIDASALAGRIMEGAFKPADVSRLSGIVKEAKEALAAGEVSAEELCAEVDAALKERKPTRLSEVSEICQQARDKQADLIRERQRRAIAAQAEAEEKAERANRWRRFVSLDEWKEMDADTRQSVLAISPGPGEQTGFNKQEGPDIEWAQWSWNPITGCLHDCPYCYARDIANQKRMAKVYPYGFAPTLHPLRLAAPQSMRTPKEAAEDTRFRNVFTGSMSDIFGRWVPEEWIKAVLSQVRAAPQWNFLFLTKFPMRMAEFDIPDNAWVGTSVDLQARVPAAEKAFAKVNAKVKWLSIEPMLEPLKFSRLDLFNWVVVGGASRSSKTPEWKPPFSWIFDIKKQADEAGAAFYAKTNLLGSTSREGLVELPFNSALPAEQEELPDVFRYLGRSRDKNKAAEAVE